MTPVSLAALLTVVAAVLGAWVIVEALRAMEDAADDWEQEEW
jgi:hypothetical protein